MPRVPPVNPLPRQIGRCGEVFVTGRELCLQSPHTDGAHGLPGYGATVDNPSHRGIASRAVGVVYVLIATEAAEDGSAKQSPHRVPAVLAGARIDRLMAGHVRQAERAMSVVIPQPWNSSFRRRSKSSRRGPSTGSPAGFAICRATKCAQDIASHHGTDDQSHQSMEPYGKCGVNVT